MGQKILCIDCGTVLTRALLVKTSERFDVLGIGEAPTTAGGDCDDLAVGAKHAISRLEQTLDTTLIQPDAFLRLAVESGVDRIVVISNVHGVYTAAVAGVFKDISAESAKRAVLLSGGLVSDVFAMNDERPPYEMRMALGERPLDFLVLAGGVDDPTKSPGEQALLVAQLLCAGLPQSRVCPDKKPTVVFAGSAQIKDEIAELFSGIAPFLHTQNLRPEVESENLGPVSEVILKDFWTLGAKNRRYKNLGKDAIPAGYAAVQALKRLTENGEGNSLVISLDTDYTTMCSAVGGVLNRTATGILNGHGGIKDVTHSPAEEMRAWFPYGAEPGEAAAFYANRMLWPQAVPQTWEDIAIAMAALRTLMRSALEEHQKMATALRGVQKKREIWEVFGYQTVGARSLVDLSRIHNILLSGDGQKFLSPQQLMLATIEGLQTVGVNRIYRDENSLLGLVGVLFADSPSDGASFEQWFSPLGTVIAPVSVDARGYLGSLGGAATVVFDNGETSKTLRIPSGTIELVGLVPGHTAQVSISPPNGVDYGMGPGKRITTTVTGGDVGVVLDTRARPFVLPANEQRRRARLLEWWEPLDIFPEEVAARWQAKDD